MPGSLIRAGLLAAVITAVPALAQDSSVPSETGSDDEAPAISVSRVAGGVREYPARVLRSLLQLAEDPLVLRQLADEPELLERPEDVSPPVPAEMHAAIRELSVMPAIVAVAAEHPAEMTALRELYAEAPEEMEEYTLQLRAAYDQAKLGAAVAWQEALERDPAALEAYRELVTRFCEAQRKMHTGYPCVQVLDRDYYYACPPNEAIIFHAIENAESSPAIQAIEQWWESYAPYELDVRILNDNQGPIEFEIGPGTVAAMPPERRASMWKAAGGSHAGSIGLVPVIMQPPADQPPEAHYARAVAEHARLWTPELPPEPVEERSAETYQEPADSWIAGDEGGDALVEDWPYAEEPVEEVAYVDDVWDYTSDWAYGPAAYSPVSTVSRHIYYTPIVTYYRGYPIDWPLFYGCDPHWLARFRICSAYVRCGYSYGVHRSHRAGSRMTVCFDLGGRSRGYCDWSRRHGHRGAVRIGRRSYYRCAPNQIARVLHHRRSYHGLARGGPRLGADYARQRLTSGIRLGVLRPPTRTSTRPRSVLGHLRSVNTRSGRALRPSTSGRGPRSSPGRISRSHPTGSRPRIVLPHRSGSSSRNPSVSPRPRTSSRPRSVLSPRGSSSSRRSPSVSPRPRTSSRPRSVISPRPRTSSRPRSVISPRRSSSSRRSPSVSPRSRTSSRPRSVISPRGSSSSRRSPSVSPRPRTSSRPRSFISPRRSSSSRRSPSVSPRPRTSSRPRSVISPRGSSSSRRSPSVSPRSRTSSRPRSVISSRQGHSSRRSPGASSRRSTSPRPSRSRERTRAR